MKVDLEVFDPAMCCSTGVCGPDVDPKLVHFAADLDYLKNQGVEVRRHNLAHEPGEFINHAVIKDLLARQGIAALPALLVNGKLVSSGCYPDRKDLAKATGVPMGGSAAGAVTAAVPAPASGGCGCRGASAPVTIGAASSKSISCCGGAANEPPV